MNYKAAEDFVFDYLGNHLPGNLYYHHLNHTRDVIRSAVRLCELEKLDGTTTTVVKTAALFHDTGFATQYEKNEPVGAAFAEQWLPEFNYTPEQIQLIRELILATDITTQPNGLLQKIMRDADLDYIGRADFFSISQSLRQELFEHGKVIKLADWYSIEKEFLENHVYFTDSAYRLRHKGKLLNLEEIKLLLKETGIVPSPADLLDLNIQPLAEDRQGLLDVLGKTSLFRNADLGLLEHIARVADRIRLKADEPLFKKGDAGESMYIIEEGKLRVHDDQITFAELGPAEYFGEASLIDNSPRTASVSAATDACILRIGEKDFFSLLGSHPSMNRLLMKELINRLRNQNNAVVNEYKSREKKLQELVELRTMQIVEEKKKVEKKSLELELAMKELQEAQKLLIHQEKMASLGQLTTGVAHELMNPLNFVNNFSSVSIDLVQEIKDAVNDEEVQDICNDVLDNLKRISQHGHRAGEIVRSMADHSAAFGKEKQAVDLHAVIEDAVGVSLRAWESSMPDDRIRVDLQLEASAYTTLAVYSDLFRVIINLLRNAGSAIQDRRLASGLEEGLIRIQTLNRDQQLIIHISDNGIGIPEENLEKIFLPFFTTRPTGKGVGLGLSISHQILTAYGGEIAHEASTEGAVFRIVLPVG
ncbi:MAG: cyclic nucleotide-binding domain-containing protein [Bacteroidia bacterium]|nr:cyclic nucleotide-binding domain-containing protein [Bacteroidia bacterium]